MENQNSVCYVGIVTEIKAIDGADNIELAVVGGWNAIVKKRSYLILTLQGKMAVFINKWFPKLADRLTYNVIKKEPNSPFK